MRIEAGYEAQQAAIIVQLWDKSGVPKRHKEKALEYSTPEPWRVVRSDVIAQRGSGFLIALLGDRGPGKTQIAVDVIRVVVKEDKTALYTKAIDLLMFMRHAYNRTELSEVKDYFDCSLLVVDAIEERIETPNDDRLLSSLIDKRYDAQKDTLLVANLLPEEFKKAVGKSIYSRMDETGGVIICDWESFR